MTADNTRIIIKTMQDKKYLGDLKIQPEDIIKAVNIAQK